VRTAGLTDVVVQRIGGPAWTAAKAAANGPLADVVFTEALAFGPASTRINPRSSRRVDTSLRMRSPARSRSAERFGSLRRHPLLAPIVRAR
jgi:hypothetical protein